MNAGLIFYWICWIFWIITTFFMGKGRKRTLLSCLILIIIACSSLQLSIKNFPISVAMIILLFVSLLMQGKLKGMVYHSFSSFIVAVGYTAILLWENSVPYWFILPRYIIIPVLIVFLITLLTKNVRNRLVIGLAGMVFGEFMYSLILGSYAIPEMAGEMEFFDCLLLVITLIISLDFVVKIKNSIALYLSAKQLSMTSRLRLKR